MQPVPSRSVPPAPTDALAPHYVSALRQRFRAEVNRLTGGAMRALLGDAPGADDLAFLLSYLDAFTWLRREVHPGYRAAVIAPFRSGDRAGLMDPLVSAPDAAGFARGAIDHLLDRGGDTLRERQQLTRLLRGFDGDRERLARAVLAAWRDLDRPDRPPAEAYRDIAREERERYAGMLGAEDRERLALVDALPDPPGGPARFAKLGVVPAMGCPQTCRHCMFVWRPPMRNVPDPADLYRVVASHTENVLFTGGDLTRHLHHFVRAIREMRAVRTFAILLNGEFAENPAATDAVLDAFANAVRDRPRAWPAARVLLQVSFDELHQEIVAEPDGTLRERIPVARIAHVVERAPAYPELQLCLVHKQTALNFSMDLFRRGVFGRLVEELGRRGHRVQVLAASPSPRLKQHPHAPATTGRVVKDASFVLARFPDRPILLTSSTIDAYGRAALLEPGEAVNERALLRRLLEGGDAAADPFDTDLMFWFNGWATLFSAVHVCLGNLHEDDPDRVLARHRKDPLTSALRALDRRLLGYYGEVRDDLAALVERATSPHHLFHVLTEDPAVRLHLTRRLAGA